MRALHARARLFPRSSPQDRPAGIPRSAESRLSAKRSPVLRRFTRRALRRVRAAHGFASADTTNQTGDEDARARNLLRNRRKPEPSSPKAGRKRAREGEPDQEREPPRPDAGRSGRRDRLSGQAKPEEPHAASVRRSKAPRPSGAPCRDRRSGGRGGRSSATPPAVAGGHAPTFTDTDFPATAGWRSLRLTGRAEGLAGRVLFESSRTSTRHEQARSEQGDACTRDDGSEGPVTGRSGDMADHAASATPGAAKSGSVPERSDGASPCWPRTAWSERGRGGHRQPRRDCGHTASRASGERRTRQNVAHRHGQGITYRTTPRLVAASLGLRNARLTGGRSIGYQ